MAERETHGGGSGSGSGAGGGSSSIDGLGSITFASLDLAPLSLANPHPLLDSDSGGNFDPDEFLCSRATGTRLGAIVAELEAHHAELQTHLFGLVQSHAGAFKELGSEVQKDAETVEHLGQVNFQLVHAFAAVESGSGAGRRKSSVKAEQAGLDHVRRVVERTRDQLQSVQLEVDCVVEERKLCTQVQSQLSVLLALHQCILRLEALLGIPASSHERRRVTSRTVSGDSTATLRKPSGGLRPVGSTDNEEDLAADEDDEEDEADAILNSMGGLVGTSSQLAHMEEYGLHSLGGDSADESLQDEEADVETDLLGVYAGASEEVLQRLPLEAPLDDTDPLGAILSPQAGPSATGSAPSAPQLSPRTRRKSLAARRRSSAQSISMSQATAALWQPSGSGSSATAAAPPLNPLLEVLPLPQRLAKALEELSHLITLVGRAIHEDLRSFVLARTRRLNGIAAALQSDLKVLVSQLLGPSSLVLRPPDRISKDETLLRGDGFGQESLYGWSKVDEEGTDLDEVVIKRRRREQLSWLYLSLRSYTTLDSLLRAAASIGTESRSTASITLREELNELLRTGAVALWIQERLRRSIYTLIIKQSAETSPGPRDARPDTGDDPFPAALDGTSQIPPLSGATSATSQEEEADLRSSEALRKLYNEVLRFLAEDARALIEAPLQAGTTNDADWQLDVLDALWDEISRALLEELGNAIFFVGRPHSFQQNFNLTSRFLQILARLVPTEAALHRLLDHPGFLAFQKRWQLSVYFRIRLRAIVSELETGLSAGLSPARRSGNVANSRRESVGPQLQAIQATLTAFSAPWQPLIHIRPLTAREWTLSLQVISRFKTWLEAEVLNEASGTTEGGPKEQHGTDGANGHRGAPGSTPWMSGAAGRNSPQPKSRLGSPARGPDGHGPRDDGEEQRLLRWTWIASDVEWLDSRLWDVFEGEIVPAVQAALATDLDGTPLPGTEAVVQDMKDALSNALSYRRGFVAVLGRNIVALLKQRCASAFEVLNRSGSITRQYRAGTSSSTASGSTGAEPSHIFVGQILGPIQHYFGTRPTSSSSSSTSTPAFFPFKAALARVDVATRAAWAQDVVDDVVGRYASALGTMNKTLESLRRLKRGSTTLGFGSLFGAGGAGGAGRAAVAPATESSSGAAETDADPESVRTRKQMQADVAALEEGIRALEGVGASVALEGREMWERLKRAAAGGTEA